jgi:hypothetical protein
LFFHELQCIIGRIRGIGEGIDLGGKGMAQKAEAYQQGYH